MVISIPYSETPSYKGLISFMIHLVARKGEINSWNSTKNSGLILFAFK